MSLFRIVRIVAHRRSARLALAAGTNGEGCRAVRRGLPSSASIAAHNRNPQGSSMTAEELAAVLIARGLEVTPDLRIPETVAAIVIGQKPKTLANWRSQ